jgi:hypothetical protein
MLHLSEFYIAIDDDAQKEAIDNFMDSDNYDCMLIIDSNLAIEYIKELRGDHNCFVTWITPTTDHSNETRKGIYIHEAFDLTAKNFLLKNKPLLTFFESSD